MLAAFVTTILFSISAVCGHRAARFLGGTEANFWRLCFAALLLGVYAHALGLGLRGAQLPIFVLSGCVGFGVGDAALFQALPRLGSRLAVMMVTCLSSPMAAAAEWLWLDTTLTGAEMLAGATILAGVALALTPPKATDTRSEQFGVGVFWGLLAALCQAFGAVLSRKAFAAADQAQENIDGITAAYQRILGGILVTALFLLLVKRRAIARGFVDGLAMFPTRVHARGDSWRCAWPWVLANGLAGPALGVSCYQWALKSAPTGIVLPIVALTPIVIIPFAWFMEAERPTARSLLGGFVAVAAAVALALV